MPDNPFVFGPPVAPEQFVGRSEQLTQIVDRLRGPGFGSTSVVGERRTGKSSLFLYLADPAIQERHGLDPAAFYLLYDDLQPLGTQITPERFWRRLLRRVQNEVGNEASAGVLEEARQFGLDNLIIQDFFEALQGSGRRPVLLLDEFDQVTRNPNFGPDFFGVLRHLASHRRLALVTSSRLRLRDLTHSKELSASPFFNIFTTVYLTAFSAEEVQELLQGALAGSGVSFTEAEREMLERLSGRHPYFLQAAAHFLFTAHGRGLDQAGRQRFLRQGFEEEAGDHFADYWAHSEAEEQITLLVLALLGEEEGEGQAISLPDVERAYTRAGQALDALNKRALVVAEEVDGESCCRPFSALFAPWVLAELTRGLATGPSFADWWREQSGELLARLSRPQRDTAADLLSRVGPGLRTLVAGWLADLRTTDRALELLRSVLGSYEPLAGEGLPVGLLPEEQEELLALQEQLRQRRAQLRRLEIRQARYGMDVPVSLLGEIDFVVEDIERLEEKLAESGRDRG